ncbi:RB1-inducible coiled-coil protein [Trema orientale]|uniref:RB1-inducible coiled-coil protein n=1 Tax=Trema orientale TaxID=63057 RepID=A0A2P5EB33_TREOI|nr:RB1-inducible coiled-coil protein [Trema orientale]
MGGLLHLFDFENRSMARKVLTHKKHVDGLEAPRNSLELRIETSQSYSAVRDLPVEEDWSEKNCYPFEASMKKLINEEISKHSTTRQNAPSIVARLMGMDVLTLDTKSVVQPSEKRNENMRIKSSNKEANGRSFIGHLSSNSNSSRQMELNLSYHDGDLDSDRWTNGQKSGKGRSREHPQEEELQKFKKEFEAWQAARFRECSKFAELGSMPSQLLAQEDLNKVKMEIYARPGQTAVEKSVKSKGQTLKARAHEIGGFQHHGDQIEPLQFERKSFSSKSRNSSRDFEQPSTMDADQKLYMSSAPTKIVILKPGPDRLGDHRESWTSSPSSSEHRGSIEDFLEEVRERLKCEMQGKMLRRGSVVRGSGIETPYSEKPSDPKQIAQNIAKQVRESVSKDIGTNLPRSESTRSYKSEIQINGPSSPEFMNRDTRRLVSERLKNVLKRETNMHTGVGGHSRSYSVIDLDNERIEVKRGGDISKDGKELRNCEILKDGKEMQTRSFRHGLGDDRAFHRELSPRNLVRSLSAPVSGTSFGKLLLEDRHVLTGAHIRRKHEATETVSVDLKKRKKERFNFKEKVSNFKYSFSLRGRLFGKKIQSVVESHVSERYPLKDIMSGPTVVTHFGERHENFTEVPPSPASVCSSAQEEFWRPVDHFSPLSTPDVTPSNEYALPQVFREISSNLSELRRQLNQLESEEPEETIIQTKPAESEMFEPKDPAEVYIRDLLVASGLYDGLSEKFLWRWETSAKPISISVFEEVEESYEKSAKDHHSSPKDERERKVDHKLLLDLLNEVLCNVLGPRSAISAVSKFKRNFVTSSSFPTLYGKKLLDCVWGIICDYIYPPTDRSCHSLDGMVAQDLRLTPWTGLMDDEVNTLGREMESLIMGDLVEEILEDMQQL